MKGAHAHRGNRAEGLPYLVDLPIGAVTDQFDQLKDPSWVLRTRQNETERVSNEEIHRFVCVFVKTVATRFNMNMTPHVSTNPYAVLTACLIR